MVAYKKYFIIGIAALVTLYIVANYAQDMAPKFGLTPVPKTVTA